jgi:hypothetical protein
MVLTGETFTPAALSLFLGLDLSVCSCFSWRFCPGQPALWSQTLCPLKENWPGNWALICGGPLKDDLAGLGSILTDGRGFDTVIEASGNLGAAKQAFSLAGPGGTIVLAAVYPLDAEIPVNPFMMFARELNVCSVFVSPYSFPRALNLLPKLNLKPIISDIMPLQDIEKAFELHKKETL